MKKIPIWEPRSRATYHKGRSAGRKRWEITAGIPPLLDIGETVAEYDYRAGSYTIHVTANLPWEAHSRQDMVFGTACFGERKWLTGDIFRGEQDPQTRTAVITIGNETLNLFREFLLTQTGFVLDPRMQDSLALVEFFMDTEGETWKKNKWDLSATMDSWEGVCLNAAGRVDSLSMASNVISTEPDTRIHWKTHRAGTPTLNSNNFYRNAPLRPGRACPAQKTEHIFKSRDNRKHSHG